MAANSGFEIYFSSNKTGFENKFLSLLIRNFKKFAQNEEEFKIKNMLQVLIFYLKYSKFDKYKDLNVLFNTDLTQCFFDNILGFNNLFIY